MSPGEPPAPAEVPASAVQRAAAGRVHGESARIALYTLLGEVQGWSGGSQPEDDQTVIVARVR